jgi:hypothetical protein
MDSLSSLKRFNDRAAKGLLAIGRICADEEFGQDNRAESKLGQSRLVKRAKVCPECLVVEAADVYVGVQKDHSGAFGSDGGK